MKPRPFWDADTLIGKIVKNEREQIHVRRVAKDGREYIDVRVFYPGSDGVFRPGKGIALPVETAGDVAQFVQQAVSGNGDI